MKFSISVSQYLCKNPQDPEEQPWDITAIGEYFLSRLPQVHIITWPQHRHREHDFTLLLVAYFVVFSQRRPFLIPGFLDYTRWCSMYNCNLYPCCTPVLEPMHEQPYCAKAYLFKPGHSQESVLFSSTVQSAHMGQTNWTLGVKHANLIWLEHSQVST